MVAVVKELIIEIREVLVSTIVLATVLWTELVLIISVV